MKRKVSRFLLLFFKLKCVCDLAVKVLEIVVEKSIVDYCTFAPDCFEIPTEGSGDVYLDWNKLETQPLDVSLLQVSQS